MPHSRLPFLNKGARNVRQYVLQNALANAIFVVGVGDVFRSPTKLGCPICHGNTISDSLDYREVIVVVTECVCISERNAFYLQHGCTRAELRARLGRHLQQRAVVGNQTRDRIAQYPRDRAVVNAGVDLAGSNVWVGTLSSVASMALLCRSCCRKAHFQPIPH
jgi:hypothetical protein